MLLPALYLNGFAPRDGQPLYPSLWTGCVGAWNPGLGPSGLVLRDWSGQANHGTLTNMDAGTDWTPLRGRYGLDFDGSNDVVTTQSGSESLYDFTDATSKFSISIWAMDRSATARGSLVFSKGTAASANGGYYIDLGQDFTGTNATKGYCTLYFGSSRWTGVNFPFPANVLNHLLIVVDMTLSGTDRCAAWVNGVRSTETFSQNPLSTLAGNSNPITLGNATTNNLPFDGVLQEARIYNRALPPDEIRTLATRPGIAYEMAPRRRSSVQVTTNRLRRALIGS